MPPNRCIHFTTWERSKMLLRTAKDKLLLNVFSGRFLLARGEGTAWNVSSKLSLSETSLNTTLMQGITLLAHLASLLYLVLPSFGF